MTTVIPDRQFVIDHLHHAGECRALITSDQWWEVFCLGDGFGNLSPLDLAQINSGADWSHVRDSTPAGFARMAERLRRILAENAERSWAIRAASRAYAGANSAHNADLIGRGKL